jgi:hypothetical protein
VTVADEVYASYLRQMQLEQPPELTVQLPEALLAGRAGGGGGGDASGGAAADGGAPSAAGTATGASGDGPARATPPPPPAPAAAAAGAGTPPPGQVAAAPTTSDATPSQRQAQGQGQQPSPVVAAAAHTVSIRFSKPRRDGSVLVAGEYMVAAPQLRRGRALFPCLDWPIHYEQGAPHVAPHTFDLALTVGPEDVAVASGRLEQQTQAVACGGGAPNGAAGGAGGEGARQRVVSRTFHYAVDVPTLPAHILIAVGPFEALPAAALFASGGANSAAAAAAGPPVVTAFYPREEADGGSGGGGGGAREREEQRINNGDAAVLAALSLSGPGGSGGGGAGGGVPRAAVVSTLRPLALIFRQCEKHLGCRAPFSHLQVGRPGGCPCARSRRRRLRWLLLEPLWGIGLKPPIPRGVQTLNPALLEPLWLPSHPAIISFHHARGASVKRAPPPQPSAPACACLLPNSLDGHSCLAPPPCAAPDRRRAVRRRARARVRRPRRHPRQRRPHRARGLHRTCYGVRCGARGRGRAAVFRRAHAAAGERRFASGWHALGRGGGAGACARFLACSCCRRRGARVGLALFFWGGRMGPQAAQHPGPLAPLCC